MVNQYIHPRWHANKTPQNDARCDKTHREEWRHHMYAGPGVTGCYREPSGSVYSNADFTLLDSFIFTWGSTEHICIWGHVLAKTLRILVHSIETWGWVISHKRIWSSKIGDHLQLVSGSACKGEGTILSNLLTSYGVFCSCVTVDEYINLSLTIYGLLIWFYIWQGSIRYICTNCIVCNCKELFFSHVIYGLIYVTYLRHHFGLPKISAT